MKSRVSALTDRWRACGLPDAVGAWLASLPDRGFARVYLARARRFVEYCDASTEGQAAAVKAWRAIARAGRNLEGDDPAVLAVFTGLPDEAKFNPYPAIYSAGRRPLTPALINAQRKRYIAARDAIGALQGLLNYHDQRQSFQALLEDASANDASLAACSDFREVEDAFRLGLGRLDKLLAAVDPANKIPTPHWNSQDAARKNFVIQVAQLNRKLATPRHAALACLAGINCPAVAVKAEDIREAWRSETGKQG